MSIGQFVLLFLLIMIIKGSIAFAMFFSSAIYFVTNGLPLTLLVQRGVAGANSFILLAIPFFILAANIMNTGGVTQRIFDFANKLVGHVPGGLGHANVVASIIFAGMSGSAIADAAGLGAIEIKAMEEKGYDLEFATAITGASSIIGPIIPPSIPAVLYGVSASISVGQLFIGGVVPGLLMALLLSTMILIQARSRNYPRGSWGGFRDLGRSLIKNGPPLLTPVIILGGIMLGVVTPTESATIAILYASILSVFYHGFSGKRFVRSLDESVQAMAPILCITCGAQAFGWIMANGQVPQMVLDLFTSFISSPIVALILINIFLLVVGCFMEGTAAIIILVPVLLPILLQYGIDPMHFGIVMIINLMMGLITPPVGMVLYVLQGVTGLRFERIVAATMPYFMALMVALVIVTFVPPLVTWLPGVVFG